MSPQDETEVSKKLDALHTALLGIPGTEEKGFIGDMKSYLAKQETRLTAVEKYVDEQRGAGRVIHILWTGAVSAATAITVRLLGK